MVLGDWVFIPAVWLDYIDSNYNTNKCIVIGRFRTRLSCLLFTEGTILTCDIVLVHTTKSDQQAGGLFIFYKCKCNDDESVFPPW